MNFGGINTTDYSTFINNASTSGVSDSISKAKDKDASDAELMNACKEFEQYMVEQVFKQAMNTIREDKDTGGYTGFAYDMQAQEYARLVSEQGSFGLARQLFDSIKKNQGVTHIEEESMDEGISDNDITDNETDGITENEAMDGIDG